MVQADLKGATHAMISRKDGPPKVHEWWEWRNAYYGDRDMDLWWEAIIQLLAKHARFAQSDVAEPCSGLQFPRVTIDRLYLATDSRIERDRIASIRPKRSPLKAQSCDPKGCESISHLSAGQKES